MFIPSRSIGFVLSSLVLLAGSAWAATPTIQGNVKGPDGKPLPGAEVRIERTDAKSPASAIKADQKGHYAFKDLALGKYKLSVSANGMAATAAENVRPRTEGAVRVDFNLKQQAGAQTSAPVKKKAKQMVWVPAGTGSNLGGRWVEVDESGAAATEDGALRLKKVDQKALKNQGSGR